MQYTTLGRTGLIVSRMCLGTFTFTAGSRALKSVNKVNSADADRIVGAALEAGINLFDTADRYAGGEAERLLGSALKGRRDECVVVTKGGLRTGEGMLTTGLSRAHLLNAVEASLQRLGMDHVDIYLAHREDELTPLEETLVALDHIVRSGRARYIGFSNWSAWKVAAALEFQKANGLAQFTHGQMYYSLIGRDIEGEYARMSAHYGLGLTVWSPLAMGFLAGHHTRATVAAEESRFSELGILPLDLELGFGVIEALQQIAAVKYASVAEVALAWLLSSPMVSSLVIGVSRLEQLRSNLGALHISLSVEEREFLGELTRPQPAYPQWHIEKTRDKKVLAALSKPLA